MMKVWKHLFSYLWRNEQQAPGWINSGPRRQAKQTKGRLTILLPSAFYLGCYQKVVPTIRVRLLTLIKVIRPVLQVRLHTQVILNWQIEIIRCHNGLCYLGALWDNPDQQLTTGQMQRTAGCGVLNHKQDIWICILLQGSRNGDGEGPEIL